MSALSLTVFLTPSVSLSPSLTHPKLFTKLLTIPNTLRTRNFPQLFAEVKLNILLK